VSTGEAGPAGREGQPGPAGREGIAGRTGPIGHDGPQGKEGMEGPPAPAEAILDLTSAQKDLAAAVRLLYTGVRRLIVLVICALVAVIVFGSVQVALGQVVRDEGASGRQSFKCIIAVLFRQDPPSCPGAKEELIKEGILPPGFPVTTTTTIPPTTTTTR
jgi:hypothetical protein